MSEKERMEKPKIFAFNNGGSPGWYSMTALSEDGVFLAGHICSSDDFGPHDMGVTSDWKHDTYKKYYPDGFEVLWVQPDDPRLLEAYEKHKTMSEDEYKARLSKIGGESDQPKVSLEFSLAKAEPQ